MARPGHNTNKREERKGGGFPVEKPNNKPIISLLMYFNATQK